MYKLVNISFILFALLLSNNALSKSKPLNIGKKATATEIKGWNIDIRPDGTGLPDGQGDVATGEKLYEAKCAVCHGSFGEGENRWPPLSGGEDSLKHQTDGRPEKTISSYWPYASTVWDYIHRAMPYPTPQSLTNDEVYSIVAYVFYLNDIVDDDIILNKHTMKKIKLSNEQGFVRYSFPDTHNKACMKNCADPKKLKVTDSLRGVTPTEHLTETDTKKSDNSTQANADDRVSLGKTVYNANCVACHQSSGAGMPPTFPALKDNPLINTDEVFDVVLKGRAGTAMMPFARLSDSEVANLIVFLRTTWGDKKATDSVNESKVKKHR